MLQPRTPTNRSGLTARLLAGVAILGTMASTSALADVGEANQLYKDIVPTLRSDDVLLPLLAAMAPAPKAVGTRESSALLLVGMQGFDDAAAWSQGEPQKAVLAGLKKVTQEKDFRKAFGFGQPYGADAVAPALVRAGLYTELGDPALLPGARFLYLPALDQMLCLANVEANRLVAEKKPGEALLLLTDVLYFSRQMCDRQFMAEAAWGLRAYADTSERIRDVLYLDQKSTPHGLTPDDAKKLLERLDVSKPGSAYLDIERMRFPSADLLGFQQIADRLFRSDGSPDDAQFASTLARLRSSNRPLRLFSEAGKWGVSSAGHASKAETLRMGKQAVEDWRTRWDLGWFDPQLGTTQEYRQLDSGRFAAVKATIPDMYELMLLRQVARIEAVGTRNAAALVGATLQRGSFPPLLSAVRPQWVNPLGNDPFNSNIGPGSRPPLQYLLPSANGHDLTIVLPNETTFRVLLKNDTFILYSLGSDTADQKANRVQNTAKKVQVLADYLIYPPVLSLQRQSLVDLGQLK